MEGPGNDGSVTAKEELAVQAARLGARGGPWGLEVWLTCVFDHQAWSRVVPHTPCGAAKRQKRECSHCASHVGDTKTLSDVQTEMSLHSMQSWRLRLSAVWRILQLPAEEREVGTTQGW